VVAAALAASWFACGCRPAERMRIHYLPGFVAGSQHIFYPARIAVTPAQGHFARGNFAVGAVYDENGNVERTLRVENPGPVVTAAVMRALADAGLKPQPLAALPARAKPPPGVDFLLTTAIENLAINKRFGAQHTVHGQYFTMRADCRLKFTLSSRAAPMLFTGEMGGSEQEPPMPVGGEVFLPLETKPAESLSVAMSRAVGKLMLQPAFRAALPLKTVPPPAASPTPSATPTRTGAVPSRLQSKQRRD
jgi:hypothetical protein